MNYWTLDKKYQKFINMALSGSQLRELQNALIDAFPNIASLERMLAYELDKNLRAIAGEGSLEDIVFKLIQAANSQGWIEDLIRAAREVNPGNSRLRIIAEGVLPERASNKGMIAIEIENFPQGSIPVSTEKLSPSDNSINVFYIDYIQLQNFLVAGKWKEADYETYQLMLRTVGNKRDSWLKDNEIENFPCSVIYTIDQLWALYSKNRFGFKIQQRIWLSIGGEPGVFDSSIFRKFGNSIGWRANNEWLEYEKFSFTLDAPEGHLPSLGYGFLKNQGNRWWGLWSSGFKSFCVRIPDCFLIKKN